MILVHGSFSMSVSAEQILELMYELRRKLQQTFLKHIKDILSYYYWPA